MLQYTLTEKDLDKNSSFFENRKNFCLMILKLKLPTKDSYPTWEFSNTRINFEKAAMTFPKFKEFFELLAHLKKVFFDDTRLLKSICPCQISANPHVEVQLIYPKEARRKVLELLKPFNITP